MLSACLQLLTSMQSIQCQMSCQTFIWKLIWAHINFRFVFETIVLYVRTLLLYFDRFMDFYFRNVIYLYLHKKHSVVLNNYMSRNSVLNEFLYFCSNFFFFDISQRNQTQKSALGMRNVFSEVCLDSSSFYYPAQSSRGNLSRRWSMLLSVKSVSFSLGYMIEVFALVKQLSHLLWQWFITAATRLSKCGWKYIHTYIYISAAFTCFYR